MRKRKIKQKKLSRQKSPNRQKSQTIRRQKKIIKGRQDVTLTEEALTQLRRFISYYNAEVTDTEHYTELKFHMLVGRDFTDNGRVFNPFKQINGVISSFKRDEIKSYCKSAKNFSSAWVTARIYNTLSQSDLKVISLPIIKNTNVFDIHQAAKKHSVLLAFKEGSYYYYISDKTQIKVDI